MNMTLLTGNLTANPELRATADGVECCTFRLAVEKRKKDSKSSADFINVVAWRQLAVMCNQYLTKGRKVAVKGRIRSTQRERSGVKVDVVEIEADEVEFL